MKTFPKVLMICALITLVAVSVVAATLAYYDAPLSSVISDFFDERDQLRPIIIPEDAQGYPEGYESSASTNQNPDPTDSDTPGTGGSGGNIDVTKPDDPFFIGQKNVEFPDIILSPGAKSQWQFDLVNYDEANQVCAYDMDVTIKVEIINDSSSVDNMTFILYDVKDNKVLTDPPVSLFQDVKESTSVIENAFKKDEKQTRSYVIEVSWNQKAEELKQKIDAHSVLKVTVTASQHLD